MTYSGPGVFNVLDYKMKPNTTSRGDAENNAGYLQDAINAAQAYCGSTPSAFGAYGAIVLIPSNDDDSDGGFYQITLPPGAASSIIQIDCFYPILIAGTSRASRLIVVKDAADHYPDLFGIDTTSDPSFYVNANLGGVCLQDLVIKYQKIAGTSAPAAVRVSGGSQNIRFFRMLFVDCPTAVAFDEATHCSVIDSHTQNGDNPATVAISMGTPTHAAGEIYIAGTVLEAGQGTNAQGQGTGINVVQASNVRVANARAEGFQQGIVIGIDQTTKHGGTCSDLSFKNVTAYCSSTIAGFGAGMLIQPPTGAAVVRTVFVECDTEPPEDNPTSYTGAGMSVDGTAGGTIDQIRLISCRSCRWLGPGLQINGATNVEVLGGFYSCNGSAPDSPPGDLPSAGILIGGPTVVGVTTGIRIVGPACNNSIYDPVASPPGQIEPVQLYGIYLQSDSDGISADGAISNVLIVSSDLSGNLDYALGVDAPYGGIADLFVRRCNLISSAYGASAVHVIGTPAMQITDCPGYNDTAASIPVPNRMPASGTAINNTTYEYYGPVAFYTTGTANAPITAITVDGKPTGLTKGAFTLAPGEYATISWMALIPGAKPDFLLIGK